MDSISLSGLSIGYRIKGGDKIVPTASTSRCTAAN